MAEDTKIQWCNHTFNPWRGCTKIAAGCANCYADAQSRRNPGVLGIWGPNGTRVVAAESYWRQPLKWNREAACLKTCDCANGDHADCCPQKVRPRVFCASLADVFEDWGGPMVRGNGMLRKDAAGNWIENGGILRNDFPLTMADVRRRLFTLIDSTPWLDWLLVTKRPENVRGMWGFRDTHYSGPGWNSSLIAPHYRHNVWLLTSVSDQKTWDQNVHAIRLCRDLAPVIGVSAEPLLGSIRLTSDGLIPACGDHPDLVGYMVGKDDGKTSLWPTRGEALKRGLDWIIVGGESGTGARPCMAEWMRSIVGQCRDAEVPVFVKQFGAYPIEANDRLSLWPDTTQVFSDSSRGEHYQGMPVRLNLCDPKGGDPEEWPADLRVRQFPEVSR